MAFDQFSAPDGKHSLNPSLNNESSIAHAITQAQWQPADASVSGPEGNATKAFTSSSGDDAAKTAREMSKLGFPTPDLVGEKEAAGKDAMSKDTHSFCSIEDRAVQPDRQARGERALGKAVMDHLTDQDWLISHQDEVRRGISRAWMEVGMSEFKSFMDEIQRKSGGNLYCERGNGLLGSLNPINPPGDLVWRVYLRRGLLHPDTLLLDSRTQTQCSA